MYKPKRRMRINTNERDTMSRLTYILPKKDNFLGYAYVGILPLTTLSQLN